MSRGIRKRRPQCRAGHWKHHGWEMKIITPELPTHLWGKAQEFRDSLYNLKLKYPHFVIFPSHWSSIFYFVDDELRSLLCPERSPLQVLSGIISLVVPGAPGTSVENEGPYRTGLNFSKFCQSANKEKTVIAVDK